MVHHVVVGVVIYISKIILISTVIENTPTTVIGRVYIPGIVRVSIMGVAIVGVV